MSNAKGLANLTMSNPPRHFSEQPTAHPQQHVFGGLSSVRVNRELANWVAQLIGLFLCMAPLFLVSLRGWANAILIFGAFACVVFLALNPRGYSWGTWKRKPILILAVATLLAPVFAVAISSGLRQSLYLPLFDSPARFCLAVPVLLFAISSKFDASKFLQFAIPAGLLATLAQQNVVVQPMHWGATRMATYFADPLVFGYVSMTFGLISAISINLRAKDEPLVMAFKLVGALAGLYLSIQSGSRTGWAAVPIVLAVWAYQHRGGKKQLQVAGAVAMTSVMSAVIYFTSSTVHQRIGLSINEVAAYPWVGVAPDNAVGSRITFLRMAWDLFFQSPWSGFGDTRFGQFAVPQTINGYASDQAIHTAFNSGFHNEIVTNAIRSGIFGMVSSVGLFAVPFAVFVGKLKSGHRPTKANAVIGITFVICMFVSSLSTEILDMKYMASFYALMIAMLCGSTLAPHDHRQD